MRTKIIDLIEKNKISTTEVADALNKTGVLDDYLPINNNHFVVGNVIYLTTFHNSNWPVHEQIQNIPEGSILFIDTFDCDNRAIFGDIVTKYLILYQRVKGLIVNGSLRDGQWLRKMNYPIWCKGVSPLGCFNRKVEPSEEAIKYFKSQESKFSNSIAICDDSGCTIIDSEKINLETYNRLEFIELQEDIWYYCIDTLKWNTYETICLKRYLEEPDVLPNILRKKLEKFN